MQKIIPIVCPKCNNNHHFHKFGKDNFGHQKYRCLTCKYQFAPDTLPKTRGEKYPPCPMCGKASFLHHDYRDYFNFRCSDKKCNHSIFEVKATEKKQPSISKLFGKADLKRMRHPIHLIITVLTLFFIGKSSTRNISLMLYQLYNIKLSHVTVAEWCKKFAPIFDNISLKLIPTMDFNSDEWHADETVIKIAGKKYYIWFIIDSETRFVLGFHLSPHRSSPQAHALFQHVSHLGNPKAIVSDRYSAYKVPTKCYFPNAKHIRVETFKDDISNNLIEAFNNRFKAWYKTKRGFHSFDSANATISVFVFFFNFIRPHTGLNQLTPAQVAGANYKPDMKNLFTLAS